MDKIKFMAKFGAEPEWLEGYNHARTHSPEGVDILRAAYVETTGIIAELERASAAADSDDALTVKGQRQAKMRAATRLKSRMAAQQNAVARAQAELDKLKSKIMPEPEWTTADATAAIAIWGLLPADRLKVEIAYRQALEARDALTMRCIERLPSVHAGALPADQIGDLRLERLGLEVGPRDALQIEQFEAAVADTRRFTTDAAQALLDTATGDAVEAQTAALHKSVEAQTGKAGKV